MLCWSQGSTVDYNGVFVATGVFEGHQRAKNGYIVMLTSTRMALVAIGVG